MNELSRAVEYQHRLIHLRHSGTQRGTAITQTLNSVLVQLWLQAPHPDSSALFQVDVNTWSSQVNRHTVQEAHVFTPPLLEVGQHVEIRDWWRGQHRVRTPIPNKVHMAVDVDDGGANHSAGGDQHGVQQDVLRGVHHGAQCGAQCWVERGSRDAAGGGREVPKQRLNPNRDTDDTISVSLIPLLPSELHRVTSGHIGSQKVTGGHRRSQQVTAGHSWHKLNSSCCCYMFKAFCCWRCDETFRNKWLHETALTRFCCEHIYLPLPWQRSRGPQAEYWRTAVSSQVRNRQVSGEFTSEPGLYTTPEKGRKVSFKTHCFTNQTHK